jgi:hypothetical protein
LKSHFQQTNLENRLFILWLGFLLLVHLTGLANPPDSLTNDIEPAIRASELVSPFTEIVTERQVGWLRATSSEPFIRDTEFSLQPRFYFRDLQNVFGLHEAFATGGALSLSTGWWSDTLQLGVTGYTTQPIFAPSGGGETGLLSHKGDGFAVLGQAWAKLKIGPGVATLFRQALQLPFINGNDSRMIPNTFEAYQFDTRPSKDFRLNFGYVADMKSRTSASFEPMSYLAGVPGVNRGTGYGGFVLGSEQNAFLGAIEELTWDLFSCTYMQAGRTWTFQRDLEIRGDVQFVEQCSVGRELLGAFDTQLYGARLTASYGDALLSIEYTETADGGRIRNPFGGSPTFNSLMISNFTHAGEKAYGAGITYDFSKFGLTGVRAFAAYSYGIWATSRWQEEINATIDYRITSGALRNFWLRLRYAYNASNAPVPTEDFRVILNYTLSF